MPQAPDIISSKLNPHLPKIEIVSIGLTGVGLALRYAGNQSGDTAIMIGLSVLSGVFFLTAFVPLTSGPASDKIPGAGESAQVSPRTFADGFLTVVWKVICISSSIAVMGVLFFILQLPGYGLQLKFGAIASGISLLLAGIYLVWKSESREILKGALIRNSILFLTILYLIIMNWPLPPSPH